MELSQKDQALLKMIDEAVKGEIEMAKAMGYEMSEEEAIENVQEFVEEMKAKVAEEEGTQPTEEMTSQ